MVNVIVLFPKIDEARSIKNLLIRNGINVTKVCTTGAQAAQFADSCDDGIIICGYKFPDMLYSGLADMIPDYFEMIVVTSKRNYEDCRESGVVCLTMPLKSQDFVDVVTITIDNLLWERKKRKKQPKERTEEEKKIIKAAKLKLMNEYHYDEQSAHRYLQKKSMDNGLNIIEMAYMVLNDSGFF
ncbi:MAG: ANTAR domain-containing protein [Coprococcus sp.]|nr:ANTAR domain-containing protein [Coprococcus sp.]